MYRQPTIIPTPPTARKFAPATSEEALITDTRAGLTPAQMVERKLVLLLKSNPLPVSHVQVRSASLSRG
jgi:hypothetical protein